MQAILRCGLAAIAALVLSPLTAAADCQNGLGVARIVEIDTSGGPVFGMITKRNREDRFLGPKEVVLTFDDGPMPGVTRPILDTLDRYCTKATFFSVGKMAIAYPEQIREILKRGHTLGTHTWSHPMSLPRLKGAQARDQIESGFAAVSMAAGQPIAPFFRFPGLNDSPALIEHLESRNIATFTVDVVSNDSYIADPGRLIERTLQQLDAEKGGIMLFHDIKPQTARALPAILAEIKARGYRVVHLRAKAPFVPDPAYAEAVRAHVTAKSPGAMRQLTAFTVSAAPPAPVAAVPGIASSPVMPAQPAAASDMTAALAEPEPARSAGKPQAARARPSQGPMAETSSWTAVLSEPKAAQPSQSPADVAARREPSLVGPVPPDAPTAPPQAVAQATSDWPEVRRNGRVIRVQQPKQLVPEPTNAKPAASPAAATPVEPTPAGVPAAKSVAPGVPAAVKVDSAQPAPAAKPVVATQPSSPQRPRILNAPDASEPAAAAATAVAAPLATPLEQPMRDQAAPASKAGVAGLRGTKPAATVKPEAPAATATSRASGASAAKPADAAAAVSAPVAAIATPLAPAAASGSGIEVLAGSYNASASAVALPATAASGTTAANAPATAAEPPATAGRFAAPEIIAGSYRQQPAVPAPESRRTEGPKQKRAP